MMGVVYEGVDIYNDVEVNACSYMDSAGGHADSLYIAFSDSKGKWSKWKPEKGHRIEIIKNSISTGSMFIDTIGQKEGKIIFMANSIPLGLKTKNSRTWEKINFKQIATDIAQASGLILEMHNINDYFYKSICQINESNLAFLNKLCIREGYTLKISYEKMILYDEKSFENKPPVKTFYSGDVVKDFEDVSSDIYSSCTVKYLDSKGAYIDFKFTPPVSPYGPELKINEQLFSQAEAERYAKNYLRFYNKYEKVGNISAEFENNYATCNMIAIITDSMFDRNYFIYRIIDDFINNKRLLKVRHILEGY